MLITAPPFWKTGAPRRAAQRQRAEIIDVHLLAGGGGIWRGQGAGEGGHAGVVDQQGGVCGDGGGLGDLLRIGHVELQGNQLVGGGQQRLKRGGVASAEIDLGRAALEQFGNQSLADAAVGAVIRTMESLMVVMVMVLSVVRA
jgi:hypothetical protein